MRDRKGYSPVRNLSKAKRFSSEHRVFSEMLITFPVSKMLSALFGTNPGRRPETEFPLTRVFMNFFHKVLIYFLGEVDEDSAFRLFSP